MDWNALAPMASPDERRRRPRPVRPGLRALRHPLPQQLAADLATPPAGLTDPVVLRHAAPQRAAHPPFRRGHPGPTPQPGWPAPLVSYTVDRSPPDRPHRADDHPAGGRRGRHRHRQRRLGRPSGRQPDRPLRRHPRHRPAAAESDPEPAGRPGGDRHQPEAGIRVELAQRAHRLHRDGSPGSGHHQRGRRPPRPLPQGPGRRPDHRPPARGVLGHRLVLRLLDHLPARGPAVQRPGRQHPDRLAGQLLRPAGGQWWQVVLAQPRTESTLTLVQPQTGNPDRTSPGPPSPSTAATRSPSPWVRLRCSPPASRSPFRPAPSPRCASPSTASHVDNPAVTGGIAELGRASPRSGIPGLTVHEVIAMPQDLLRAAGAARPSSTGSAWS